MTTRSKWLLLVGITLVGIIVSAIIALNTTIRHYERPHLEERAAREAIIQPLFQTHATRDVVTNALGFDFTDYSVGSTNRAALQWAFHHPRVREASDRYPGVLFHTTAHTMTWLFFDSEGRLHDYYLCRQ